MKNAMNAPVIRSLGTNPSGDQLDVVEWDGKPHLRRVSSARTQDLALLMALGTSASIALPSAWGDTDDGRAWSVRPWIEGQLFDEAASRSTPDELARLVDDLLAALAELHASGWLHRDIKSENIIVDAAGKPHLIDLELSALAGSSASAGTAGHMAPEVLQGRAASPSTDLFALGATIAYATCGGDPVTTMGSMPAQGFWDASGADAGRLPEALAPLVRACVRRRPEDRPSSARAAQRLLPFADRPLPDLALPFLAGRRRWLSEWRTACQTRAGLHVLTVDDERDVAPLTEAVHTALSVGGRAPSQVSLADALSLEHEHGETTTLLALESDAEANELTLALRALSSALRAVVICRTDQLAATGPRLDEITLTHHAWPPVPLEALADVLAEITGGAHAAASEALAVDAHTRTGGRWAELARLIEHAERDGVLARGHRAWDVHLDVWPEQADVPHAAATAGDAFEEAVVAARAWLGDVEIATLASIVDGAEDDVLAVLARRRDTRAATLTDDARVRLGRRCADWLHRSGQRARADVIEASTAATTTSAAALLERAERARLAGRLADARRVASLVARRWDSGPDRELAAALVARLDLAMGSARHVIDALEQDWSPLGDAPPPIRVVALLAAQQAGDRERAADIAATLADERDDTARAWGIFGSAYASFLDGNFEDTLATLATGEPHARPPECDVAMRNLEGVALARIDGRRQEALAALRAASDLARTHGDAAGQARAALNLADVHRREGDRGAEHDQLQQAARGFARAGHVMGRAIALNNLGVLQRDLGDVTQALALLSEALMLRRRAADAQGAVVTAISMMLATLDAGMVGAAIVVGERAIDEAVSGDYSHIIEFARGRIAWAYALAGATDEATEALASTKPQTLAHELGQALVAFARDDTEDARMWSARALSRAIEEERLADTLRVAALVLALTPDHDEARMAFQAAAERSDLRAAEASWRRSRAGTDPLELQEMHEAFERAGRLDLARAVALELADRHHAAGRVPARRAALSSATESADALVDGLTNEQRTGTLERLQRLAGGAAHGPRDGALDLGWFVSCNRRMATEDDLDGLLLSIVDMALGATGAQRGLLVLLGENSEIDVHAARGLEGAGTAEHISSTVVRGAVESGKTIVTTDALTDDRFSSSASIPRFHLRSVVCAPLPSGDGLRGALYVDDAETANMFDEADMRVVSALADQAAVAIAQLRRRAKVESLTVALSQRVASQEEELVRSRRLLRRSGRATPAAGIIGESDAIQRVFHLIDKLGPTDLPVLVTGPTGAGKDLVARALHARSPRADQALIVENVAAIPASLLETEFFGHARGAFTGADRARSGLFKEADGGTFVLDEIAEMPLELQAKLLRVLESGEYRPIGARATETTDARIIACTHRDLHKRVMSDDFREDLFYRLNVAEIRVPSLAERLDDIPLLAEHALMRLNAKHASSKRMTSEVMAALAARTWPGQVRELFNEVGRLYYLCGDVVDDASWIRAARETARGDDVPLDLATVERTAIERALETTNGNKERAAALLGISRAGLYAKLKRHAADDASTQ